MPKVKADYLSREEEAALLGAMRRDPSPIVKRDYALFLLLLRTGWQAGVARRFTWGRVAAWDGGRQRFEPRAFDCQVQTSYPSAPARVELPDEVWRAVLDYLEASGRLDSIGPEEYIFAPSRVQWLHETGCNAADWAGERPISEIYAEKLIQRYAEWGGLRAKAITCQTLRHTAAVRCVEAALAAGEDPAAAMRRDLGWGRRSTAVQCKQRIKQKADEPLIERGCRRQGGRRPKMRSRAPNGFKPGHHRGVKHGLSARSLPEMDWLEAQGVHVEGREREALHYRLVLARIVMLSKRAKSRQELLRLSRAASKAARRLAGLLAEGRGSESASQRIGEPADQ